MKNPAGTRRAGFPRLEPPEMQRAVADIAVASGAIASPWWLDALHHGYQGFMAGGAAILLGLRLAVAYREWRRKP